MPENVKNLADDIFNNILLNDILSFDTNFNNSAYGYTSSLLHAMASWRSGTEAIKMNRYWYAIIIGTIIYFK